MIFLPKYIGNSTSKRFESTTHEFNTEKSNKNRYYVQVFRYWQQQTGTHILIDFFNWSKLQFRDIEILQTNIKLQTNELNDTKNDLKANNKKIIYAQNVDGSYGIATFWTLVKSEIH